MCEKLPFEILFWVIKWHLKKKHDHVTGGYFLLGETKRCAEENSSIWPMPCFKRKASN